MQNELFDIAEKLFDRYGSGKHWEIVKAQKNADGWFITVKPIEDKENDSNEQA